MDAHFFRCLARALGPSLAGRRVEKIHNPAPGVWTFKLQASGGPQFLLSATATGGGLLFLSPDKPENPETPSARCMWLRKRLTGRRLGECVVDWPGRMLALAVGGGPGAQDAADGAHGVVGAGGWLLLGPGREPELAEALPDDFGAAPRWPGEGRDLAEEGLWREFPVLTPALRRLLGGGSPGRARAVLDAVRRGGCAQFHAYLPEPGAGDGGGPRPQLLAWRLPEGRRAALVEEVFDDPLAAAAHLGRTLLFPALIARAEAGSRTRRETALARTRRALARLDADRERLLGMAARQADADALRGVLYQYPKDHRAASVDVPGPDGEPRELALDRRTNLVGNMERLFALAAKGRRGLEFLDGREAELRAELEALEHGAEPSGAVRAPAPEARRRTAVQKPSGAVAGVARFRTSDGFAVLRGKNAQGNHDLVRKLASPFDLWFHADHGPGAHVVLRRDHPDQEVPETSLMEAAALAAVRSHAAGGRAEVMCAQVKHVRAVRGAGPGKVLVDRRERTLSVEPDPGLEERLAED